jgi:hypothetical protein
VAVKDVTNTEEEGQLQFIFDNRIDKLSRDMTVMSVANDEAIIVG